MNSIIGINNLCILFFFLGQIPVVQLNFAALSNETPFDRDTVESCVKEVLQALARSIQSKRNVEFNFSGIGRLSIRESKVKMKFYKDFLRNMDGSGSLVQALSNVSVYIIPQFNVMPYQYLSWGRGCPQTMFGMKWHPVYLTLNMFMTKM